MNDVQKKDLVKFAGSKTRLDYLHFSLIMCKSRRLAYFTAVNIDGTQWKKSKREGDFQPDPRLKGDEDQLGAKLYRAKKSDFDRGHLVRREDPQWGSEALNKKAAQNTFWFTNCSPQHKDLNQKIWAELEANILHTGADQQNLKINVFTGPVLAKSDGIFVTPTDGKDIQIPNLFWKVVVWTKSDSKAYAVGFLQSQEIFLIQGMIIKKQLVANIRSLKKTKDEDIFEHLRFKDGKTYQVKVEEIEKLTGLKFNWKNVVRPFKAITPKALSGTTVKKASVTAQALAAPNMILNVRINGLVL